MVNKYYQNYKEKLQKEARERYQNLSDEEKEKKAKKGPRQISKSFEKKSVSIIVNVIRIFLKKKKKRKLSILKIII